MRKIALLLLLSSLPFAEGTQSWTQDSYDEFARGTSKNVAILSRGAIELAPAFKQLYNTPATFLWSIATGSDGAVYVGSGSPARVYRIERDGRAIGMQTAPLTMWADRGLQAAKAYRYRVTAINTNGIDGAASTDVEATTAQQAPSCDPYFSLAKGRPVTRDNVPTNKVCP